MVDATAGYPGYNMWGRGGCDLDNDLSRQIAEAVYNVVQATQGQNLAAIQAVNAAAASAAEAAAENRADVNRISGDIRLSQSESESRLGAAVERNGGDTRTDVNRVSGDIRLAQSESESRVGSAVERNGGDTRWAQSQSESRLGASIERNGGDTRSSVERNSGEIRQNISDNSAETRRDISDAQMVLHSTLESRTAEIRNNQTRDAAAAVLEIERTKFAVVESRCSLERQAAESLGAIQLEAAKNAAAILLESERNKYQITKQIEECCCEIKETVLLDGSKTRGLIEKNEIDRLREALEHARRETDHHRNAESIRLTVQQYSNQSQRVYVPTAGTTAQPTA